MTTLSTVGEVGLIARLRRTLHRPSSALVGIGDDAAVLQQPARGWLLFASDMLVEGIHFRLPPSHHLSIRRRRIPALRAGRQVVGSAAGTEGVIEPALIGWKALAVNLSDIAAMGGRPLWAVVSLGLPPSTSLRFVDALYRGLERCARRYGVAIVGGDTVRAPQVVVDVAILGTVDRRHLTLRRGARAGDVLFVTGRLGGSLRSGRHARCVPRLREAQMLLRRVRVRAMMDLSDGLASDLWQMSRASRVRLQVEARRIPVHPSGKTVHYALMDGEDFELLFAVRPSDVSRVPRRLGMCPVTRIGQVVGRGVGVELVDGHGRVRPLVPTGFRHF